MIRVLDVSNLWVIVIVEFFFKVYIMQEREVDIIKLKEEFLWVEDDELLSFIDYMLLGKLRCWVIGY